MKSKTFIYKNQRGASKVYCINMELVAEMTIFETFDINDNPVSYCISVLYSNGYTRVFSYDTKKQRDNIWEYLRSKE